MEQMQQQSSRAKLDPVKQRIDIAMEGKRDASASVHRTLPWLIKGIQGVFKSILKIDVVSVEIRNTRMQECLQCEYLKKNHRIRSSSCLVCGCIVWHKTHVEKEECPENRWLRAETSRDLKKNNGLLPIGKRKGSVK